MEMHTFAAQTIYQVLGSNVVNTLRMKMDSDNKQEGKLQKFSFKQIASEELEAKRVQGYNYVVL